MPNTAPPLKVNTYEIARNIVHMGIRPGTEAEMNIPEIKVELEFK